MEPTILFIAQDAEERYGVRELLERQGYEVYCRTTRIRAFQLMTVYMIDLVIMDVELEDGPGIDFLRDLRGDANFANVPTLMIGEDNAKGEVCIAAFEAGANDFIQTPFVPGVCLARVKHLLSRRLKSRAQVKSSLSVEVSAGELPGILQYLEAEVKSGKLSVKGPHGTAVVYINEGKFVHATAPLHEGTQALAEALSWERSQVTFDEAELKEHEIKEVLTLTSVLMNAVVDVDEYREAKRRLPPSDAMFVQTGKKPPESMPRNQRLLREQALNGYSSDELLNDQPYGERQATLWLRELIEEGYLKVIDPPFHEYTRNTFEYYKRNYYLPRLQKVRAILADIEAAPTKSKDPLPMQAANWISPAAKLIITGDRPDHVQLFMDSIKLLFEYKTKKSPPLHQLQPGTEKMRLDFGDKNILDIQRLPPVLEQRFLKSLDEYLEDTVAVLMIATEQTRKANQMNLRLIRQIRQRSQSVFYNVVPRVVDRDGRNLFKLDCLTCGYRLAVDMEEAGNQGECPICNADVMIPDALDHLANALQLASDVPIVMIEPANVMHVRDLLVLMIESIEYAANPPEDALTTPTSKPSISANPDVRERNTKTVQEKIQPAHHTHEEKPTPSVDDLDDESAAASAANELSSILNLASLTSEDLDDDPGEATTDDTGGLDLDELLNSPDDDFDIDDFIKRVQKD